MAVTSFPLHAAAVVVSAATLCSTGCGASDTPEPGTEIDSGAANLDSGAANLDSGAANLDSGTVTTDTGTATIDTGTASDSGDTGTSTGGAAAWIAKHFAGAPVKAGDFTTRQVVETPVLIKDATACCAKYGFDLRESVAPVDPSAGFINVVIKDLVSSDAFGGGIQTSNAPGATMYLANVRIEPNWPTWVSYATTNKDGMVLDGSAAIYGEDVTIKNWNADGAIDNKAKLSQFVRLKLEGKGHRGIRYWAAGPHYLVQSTLENTGGAGEGSIFWFSDCATAEVRIYASTFNGAATIPSSLVKCATGASPKIVYLTKDPRTTGEMHAMFSP